MNLETQAHVAQLRQALTWRIRDLCEEIALLAVGRDDNVIDHDVTDRKDEAQAWQRADVAGRSEQIELEALRDCEAALTRLNSGEYGDCRDCHEPIDLRRLLVQPEAERCAGCQQARERDTRAP